MAKDILDHLDELEPHVRDAFLKAIKDIQSEAQMAMLIGRYEAGDIEGFIRVLNLRDEFFAPLDDALRAAYLEGGRNALVGLPVLPDPLPGGAWLRGLTAVIRARSNICSNKAQS